jgi:hypothetical protein
MPNSENMMAPIPPEMEQEIAESDEALNTLREQVEQLDAEDAAMDDEEEQFSTIDVFENFAEKDAIVEEVKKLLYSTFTNIQFREDMEGIWNKNDLMYRVKPESTLKEQNRANESHGVFTVGINQLVGMAYKTFTDGIKNYGYEPAKYESKDTFEIIRKNAEILTRLLQKSMSRNKFKRELRKSLFQTYLHGTTIAMIPWESEKIVLEMLDRAAKGKKIKKKTVNVMDLPGFEMQEIQKVYIDPNIDDIDAQQAIYIKAPVQWNELFQDSEAGKIKLPTKDDDKLRDTIERYREVVSSTENVHENNRATNAGRTLIDRQTDLFKHWIVWIMLPLDPDTGKWDENGQEYRYRVRLLGDPLSCDVMEIRRNPFPDGVPLIKANQGEDDIGFYHISLGEKVESHFDQLCTAINQMTDNRSKNVRRPIIFDPMRLEADKYDFGHSNTVPCQGDPRTAMMELQLADMTGTIMQTILFNEQKIKEIMSTTDPVMGITMGGRTSASEYQGAKAAATTPIFADLTAIEEDLIVGYMRKFAVYVNNYMSHKQISDIIGPDGMEFNFDFAGHYTPVAKAVQELRDKLTMSQFYMQLYQMVNDEHKRNRILLRMAEIMDVENPHELIPETGKDQAIKAALWENTAILQYEKYDMPQPGEDHKTHLEQHYPALWRAQKEKLENANILAQHINLTETMKREEKMAGAMNPLSTGGQPQTDMAPATPGEESGQAISAVLGAQQVGGTPEPL